MRYTDEHGKEKQTPYHGITTNLDWAERVKARDNRGGCPGAKREQADRKAFNKKRK